MAKAEVPADHHVAHPHALQEDLFHEGFGAALGKLPVEMHGHHVVDAKRFQDPRLDAEGRKPEGGLTRLEDLTRVGLEGQNEAGRARRRRRRLRTLQQSPVAQVHAVEVADGHHAATRRVG